MKTSSGRGERQILLTALKCSLPLCILFASAIVKVMWTSETEALNKKAVSIEGKISALDRERENLGILIEQNSGKSVLYQVKRYNLELNYARPGQFRRIEVAQKDVKTPKTPDVNAKPILLSQKSNVKNADNSKYYR